GARVLVLETRQRPGGRAVSWSDPKTGELRDNGQHVLGAFYSETLRLLARLGTTDALDCDPTFRLRVWERSRGEYEFRCPRRPAPLHWAAAVATCGGWSLTSRAAALRIAGRAHAIAGANADGSPRVNGGPRANGSLPENGGARSITVQRWLELGAG